MVIAALLCSLGTLILSFCWGVVCVRRCSTLALRATRREKAPEKWQSRVAELESEVLSLSSTFEKVARQTQRLNSRAGMRELRAEPVVSDAPPPLGAPKEQLRDFYIRRGLRGVPTSARIEPPPLGDGTTTKE